MELTRIGVNGKYGVWHVQARLDTHVKHCLQARDVTAWEIWVVRVWIGFICFRIEFSAEHDINLRVP
jgi:hypothetical protein